jgi:hypothetical protein
MGGNPKIMRERGFLRMKGDENSPKPPSPLPLPGGERENYFGKLKKSFPLARVRE